MKKLDFLKIIKKEIIIALIGVIYFLIIYGLFIYTNFNEYIYLLLDDIIWRSNNISHTSWVQNQYELEIILVIFLIPIICLLYSFYFWYIKLYKKYGLNVFIWTLKILINFFKWFSLVFMILFILGSSWFLFDIWKDYDIGYLHFLVFSIFWLIVAIFLNIIYYIWNKYKK